MKRSIVVTVADGDKVMLPVNVQPYVPAGPERGAPGYIADFGGELQAGGDSVEEACDNLALVLS